MEIPPLNCEFRSEGGMFTDANYRKMFFQLVIQPFILPIVVFQALVSSFF